MAKVAQIPDKPVGLGALSQSQSCRRRWKIARGVETIMLVCDILFLRSFKARGQRSRSAVELRPGLAGGMAEVARAPLPGKQKRTSPLYETKYNRLCIASSSGKSSEACSTTVCNSIIFSRFWQSLRLPDLRIQRHVRSHKSISHADD